MNNTILIAGIALGAVFVGMFAFDDASAAVFAKYDGVDGEATDKEHKSWIDLLTFDWEVNKPNSGASGQSRRRGAVVVEDMVFSMDYNKASPKLAESVFTGKVFPLLEVEFTRDLPCPEEDPRGDTIPPPEGTCEQTYLRYELKNVLVTSYNVSGDNSESPPTVVVGNNFEEIKVTYTEYDDDTGMSKGNVEYSWKIEKGEK